jgi:hypothetical protein
MIYTFIPFYEVCSHATGTRSKIAVSVRLHASNFLRAAELTSKKFYVAGGYMLMNHLDIAKIGQK